MWAGHDWRKEGSFIKAVIKENLTGKIPLGRPRLGWEDRIKKDVKAVEPNTQDGLGDRNPQEEEEEEEEEDY
ncbi:Hypothetical protein CINCED_3A008861 [Cinara cedri]|uniref:Uncharacterized protein n=1 Tax=Cinara cedri TaxID=506608 RepID=A0A5E4NHL0_9HEMI|nr:Hypothetical protein CINCED_3A008861 [Cinara cedri]